jgi:5-methylcytosine-specific restriction endonuclease McrA
MARREFKKDVRLAAWKRSDGHCEGCGAFLYVGKYEFDHRIPCALGGEPTLENCVVLCTNCHGAKTAKEDVPRIAKAVRGHAKHIGAKPPSRNPIPGGKRSAWKKKLSGEVVPRHG